jgi:hypothetical protein
MNDMSLLLDLMRGWLALLSVVATLLWLLYPKEPKSQDASPRRGLDFVDEPDAGRRDTAAGCPASLIGPRRTSDASATVLPVVVAWYPEHLDLHTGEPIPAGAGAGSGERR